MKASTYVHQHTTMLIQMDTHWIVIIADEQVNPALMTDGLCSACNVQDCSAPFPNVQHNVHSSLSCLVVHLMPPSQPPPCVIQVPAMKLCVSCHSRVNSAQLLRARPQASLHLNLRGTTTDQLRMLVDCASAVAASQPGAGDFIAASSSGARAVGSNVTSDHSAGPHRAIKQQGCLVALDLQRSQEVTDEVVTELLQVLPSLTSVTLSSCRHVTAGA